MERCNHPYEEFRKSNPIECKFPFTSSRKRMGTIFWDASNSRKILLEKGASELVLEACNKFHNFDGTVVPLDNFIRNDINKAIEGYFQLYKFFHLYRNGF